MSRMIRRLIFSFIALTGIVSFSFILVHFVPGDPVDLILGEQASALDQMELRKQMGFDQPLWRQYFHYVVQAFQFDLGRSVYDQQSVTLHIRQAFFPTLFLTLSSLFLSLLWGIPLGVLSAVYKNSFLDRLGSLVSVCGFSLPVFFSAPLLIWVFSIYWPIFPVSGQGSFIYYILPSVSLALPLGLCSLSDEPLLFA